MSGVSFRDPLLPFVYKTGEAKRAIVEEEWEKMLDEVSAPHSARKMTLRQILQENPALFERMQRAYERNTRKEYHLQPDYPIPRRKLAEQDDWELYRFGLIQTEDEAITQEEREDPDSSANRYAGEVEGFKDKLRAASMASHSRLGRNSPLSTLPDGVLARIYSYAREYTPGNSELHLMEDDMKAETERQAIDMWQNRTF